eukprot:3158017-Rhodomonas_salina.1
MWCATKGYPSSNCYDVSYKTPLQLKCTTAVPPYQPAQSFWYWLLRLVLLLILQLSLDCWYYWKRADPRVIKSAPEKWARELQFRPPGVEFYGSWDLLGNTIGTSPLLCRNENHYPVPGYCPSGAGGGRPPRVPLSPLLSRKCQKRLSSADSGESTRDGVFAILAFSELGFRDPRELKLNNEPRVLNRKVIIMISGAQPECRTRAR